MAGARLDWTYLDEERTHEVQLALSGTTLTVIESGFREADPAAQLRVEHTGLDEWDARSHKAELEARLGMLGQYWRNEGAGWRPLPRRPAIVDLRALDLPLGDGGRHAGVHHFHHPAKSGRMLLSLPPSGALATRALLAEFELDALAPTTARLLHPALTTGPLRSLLAAEHLRAHEAGYGKLRSEHEFALVFGPDWRSRLLACIAEGASHLKVGQVWRKHADRVASTKDDLLSRAEALLMDPRLRALHERYLAADEQERLMREGDLAIVHAVQVKRRSAPHDEQHLLSVLEASLLLRERLRTRAKLDPELVDRAQRLAFYLPKLG
jgi:hypothetical protein